MGQKRGKLIEWVGGGEGRRVDFPVEARLDLKSLDLLHNKVATCTK